MFDPYHKWLGIPPSEQPPNHYRLLGISLFEANPDVIDAAANRQMAYLQGCAAGPHVALSQKLLNKVAAARLCLLTPDKKSLYDALLKRRCLEEALRQRPASFAEVLKGLDTGVASSAPAPVVQEQVFDFERPEREPVDAPRARTTRKKPKKSLLPWVLGGVGLLAVALVVVFGFVLGGSKKEGPRLVEPGNKAALDQAGGKRVSADKDEQPANIMLSTLDRLDAANIPANQRLPSQPSELVAVLGNWAGSPVRGVAFTPDSKLLAAAVGKVIRLIDLETQHESTLEGHTYNINQIAMTPDGKHLASAGGQFGERGGQVRVWDIDKRTEHLKLQGHDWGASSVAWGSDGLSVASGAFGGPGITGEIILWSSQNGMRQSLFYPVWPSLGQFHTQVHCVTLATRKRKLAASSGHPQGYVVGVWDLERKTPQWASQYGCVCRSLAFSPVDEIIIAGYKDGVIVARRVSTGEEMGRLQPQPKGDVSSLTFSPDGKMLACTGADGTVIVWDWDALTLLRLPPRLLWKSPHRVNHVAFAPDSRHLATANANGTVYIFRLP
jgi:hypothetical protein